MDGKLSSSHRPLFEEDGTSLYTSKSKSGPLPSPYSTHARKRGDSKTMSIPSSETTLLRTTSSENRPPHNPQTPPSAQRLKDHVRQGQDTPSPSTSTPPPSTHTHTHTHTQHTHATDSSLDRAKNQAAASTFSPPTQRRHYIYNHDNDNNAATTSVEELPRHPRTPEDHATHTPRVAKVRRGISMPVIQMAPPKFSPARTRGIPGHVLESLNEEKGPNGQEEQRENGKEEGEGKEGDRGPSPPPPNGPALARDQMATSFDTKRNPIAHPNPESFLSPPIEGINSSPELRRTRSNTVDNPTAHHSSQFFPRTRSLASLGALATRDENLAQQLKQRPRMLSVSKFQEKVAQFDKATWEKLVEQRIEEEVLISTKARKAHKPRPELIDVDLVRGSTFAKAKPAGTELNSRAVRVLFFPFFRSWWAGEVSTSFFLVASLVYAFHVATLLAYATADIEDDIDVTLLEVLLPVFSLVLLSVGYALITVPSKDPGLASNRSVRTGGAESSGGGPLKKAATVVQNNEQGSGSESSEPDEVKEEAVDGQDDDQSTSAFVRRPASLAGGLALKISAVLSVGPGMAHKIEMSLPHIVHMISCKVEEAPETMRFLYIGVGACFLSAALPTLGRLYEAGKLSQALEGTIPSDMWAAAFGESQLSLAMVISSAMGTFFTSFFVIFALVVAEHAYFHRYLYAKYFGALTSSCRARRYGLPHFRLHKVVNIKMWLALRSFLKRRGPQRSVDTMVSFCFILVLVLVGSMSLKAATGLGPLIQTNDDRQVVLWGFMLSVYLLRFMTLGTHINQKYQNTSLLLTEQINLYLRMEQTPHKKDELGICNNVLGLSAKLLQELEAPYKVSGMSMSPMLYNITRVVVLSAFSSVLSDVLGFKLKIWKAVGKK